MTTTEWATQYSEAVLARQSSVPAHLAGGAAATIRRPAIIGGGLMASQLATLLLVHARVPVVVIEIDEERALAAHGLIRARLARLARRGSIYPAEAESLGDMVTATANWDAVTGSDFVIEAIYEDLNAKRTTFAEAEKHVPSSAVLATNTSSLSITEIADGLEHPERVVGFHVFNPVEVVPLVELVPGALTAPNAMATVLDLAARLKRVPVVSADAPGFIVNRMLTRMFDEIFRAIDAGEYPALANGALAPIGLPMTPLQLLDFVGPAVQLHVCETMNRAFPDRYTVPAWLQRLVAAEVRLTLTPEGAISPAAAALLPPTSGGVPSLLDRTLDALADEAERLVAEGVVADVSEVDRSLLLGANWPRANGGLTPLLDRLGVSARVRGSEFHAPRA